MAIIMYSIDAGLDGRSHSKVLDATETLTDETILLNPFICFNSHSADSESNSPGKSVNYQVLR